MMKPDEKAAWVAALRSGDYQQGRMYLSCKGRQCCLGVKCMLDDRFVIHESAAHLFSILCSADRFEFKDGLVRSFMSASFPTDEALIAWGLSRVQARLLAKMNDDGRSFAEIADYIESSEDI